MADLSGDSPDDLEGLDASAAHVANLLSTEPADSKFLFYSFHHILIPVNYIYEVYLIRTVYGMSITVVFALYFQH